VAVKSAVGSSSAPNSVSSGVGVAVGSWIENRVAVDFGGTRVGVGGIVGDGVAGWVAVGVGLEVGVAVWVGVAVAVSVGVAVDGRRTAEMTGQYARVAMPSTIRQRRGTRAIFSPRAVVDPLLNQPVSGRPASTSVVEPIALGDVVVSWTITVRNRLAI
jgi:hypothetical protein